MQAAEMNSSAPPEGTAGNGGESTGMIDMVVGDPFGDVYEGLCQADHVVSMLWAAETLVDRLRDAVGVDADMARELGHVKNVLVAAGEKLEGIVKIVDGADTLLTEAGCRRHFRRVQ